MTYGLDLSSICAIGPTTCRASVAYVPTGGDGGVIRVLDVSVDGGALERSNFWESQPLLRINHCSALNNVSWHAGSPAAPSIIGTAGFGRFDFTPTARADLPVSSLEHFWFHADAGFVTRTFSGASGGPGGTRLPFAANTELLLSGASAGNDEHYFFGTNGYVVRTVYVPRLVLADGGFDPSCDGGCNGRIDLADVPRLGTRDLLASTAVDLFDGGRQLVVVGRGAYFSRVNDGGFVANSPASDLDFTAVWVSSRGSTWVVGQTDAGAQVFANNNTGWQRVFTSPTPVRGVAGVETDAGTTVWLVGNSGLFLRRTFP